MTDAALTRLSGWGRYPTLACRVARLRDGDALAGLLKGNDTLIARGNGRAYGDAALNPELTVSMLAMNRLQSFDDKTGLLRCEAGALLADIIDAFALRGWFPPVVPGTRFVTVGGMIAADVHGKNHHRDGSFGAHLESLTLATLAGPRECSRSNNAELFYATIGGMGLTGVILSASFRLRPVETTFLLEETIATNDLDETMALFEESQDWPYSVAWLDSTARGPRQGRALLLRGRFMARGELPPRLASRPLRRAAAPLLTAPAATPAGLLNRVSLRLFNELRYHRGAWRAGPRPASFDRFFFPLDRIGAWHRLYGKRGFAQHQCALPKSESARGLQALLACAAQARPGPCLAVLKLLGPAGEGLLSFPMEGYTLAVDVPMNNDAPALMAALDRLAHDHGGRVYFAKDSCCDAAGGRQGYPHYERFAEVRSQAAGAPPRFASALSRRLAL